MIDSDLRSVVLKLRHEQGKSKRGIARALGISRKSVRKILNRGTDEVPTIERRQLALPHLDRIRELHDDCSGNLVRVHEILNEEDAAGVGVELPYSTLTAFCRRHGIGTEPPQPKGRYTFEPGEETQHDTSPHDPIIASKPRRVQCAAAVLCFSCMNYAQVYPTFNRFYCKVFLTEAFEFFAVAAVEQLV